MDTFDAIARDATAVSMVVRGGVTYTQPRTTWGNLFSCDRLTTPARLFGGFSTYANTSKVCQRLIVLLFYFSRQPRF